MDDFYIGQELSWLHGLHSHRVGTVLEIEKDRVKIQGVETDYWIKKETLRYKINRPHPRGGLIICDVCYSPALPERHHGRAGANTSTRAPSPSIQVTRP